jgi:hypothetical protein
VFEELWLFRKEGRGFTVKPLPRSGYFGGFTAVEDGPRER